MARTAAETANVLSDIYDENFGNDSYARYRIGWPELRSIAGLPKLTEAYLLELANQLKGINYLLIPCDDFLVIAMQGDFADVRPVPARLIEQNLDEEDADIEIDEEDHEVPNEF